MSAAGSGKPTKPIAAKPVRRLVSVSRRRRVSKSNQSDASAVQRRAVDVTRKVKTSRQIRETATGRRHNSVLGKPRPRVRGTRAAETINPPRLGNPIRRLRFALAFLLALFVVLGGRLVYLQATDGAVYAAKALADRTRHVDLMAERGSILDRNGTPLAQSVPANVIYTDPQYVKDPVKAARKLSGLLGIAESELLPKLERKRTEAGGKIRFAYLARGVELEVGQIVAKAKIPGVYIDDEQRRDVPGHDLAANLIGFTGIDGNGLAGIEASYEKVLAGTNGERDFEVGAQGQEIPDGYHRTVPANRGGDIRLTIDSDLQYEAQQLLAQRLQDVHAINGAAVVLDARSGEILAMASYPTYDAANPGLQPIENQQDMASGSVIEPGSVHKAITLSAALNEGKIQPDSTIPIGPTITKGDQTFRDTHPHGDINITLQGIMAESSNVGAISVADKIGANKLYEYQKRFGLAEQLNIGLPGQAGGLVQPPKNWSGSSHGSIPIGLGVAVTPLQMTAAYATIANDGLRVTPTLIQEISDQKGKFSAGKIHAQKRVISAKTARCMRETMEAVISEYGTAPKAAVPGYRVSGKTGTGLRVVNGKYTNGDVTSFIGMVPAESPKYVIGIFAHVPSGEGGGIAAPVFSDLAGFTLRHYGIAPANTEAPPIRITA